MSFAPSRAHLALARHEFPPDGASIVQLEDGSGRVGVERDAIHVGAAREDVGKSIDESRAEILVEQQPNGMCHAAGGPHHRR